MTGSQSAKRHKAAGGAERGQQSRAWMGVQALSHADSTPTWPGHRPMKGPNDRTAKRRGPARGRRAETLTTAGRRRGGETDEGESCWEGQTWSSSEKNTWEQTNTLEIR